MGKFTQIGRDENGNKVVLTIIPEADYYWKITRDLDYERTSTDFALRGMLQNFAGMEGPAYPPLDLVMDQTFRMLDGDEQVLYEGVYGAKPDSDTTGFEPLDDIGYANGCTSIEYWENEQWLRL